MAKIVVTDLFESRVDHVADVQGVVGTGDNAEMTDGEERDVI